MSETSLILRRWTGVIRTADEADYVAYIDRTGTADYAATPGNRGFQMLLRALGDGRSEVTTLSWWESLDAIRGFAGEDIEVARYYPEDDRFLLERPHHVEHHRVVSRSDAIW
jgi:heme-degrading monooxygenase HmoA